LTYQIEAEIFQHRFSRSTYLYIRFLFFWITRDKPRIKPAKRMCKHESTSTPPVHRTRDGSHQLPHSHTSPQKRNFKGRRNRKQESFL